MDQRIQRGLAATLRFTLTNSDEVAVDAAGVMTVTVTRADGTAILTNAATTHGATGEYSVALTAAQNLLLDELTATWTDSAAPTVHNTTTIGVAGGQFLPLSLIRTFESLKDTVNYPTDEVLAARVEVEDEAEWIIDAALVPRYRRLILNGSGTTELVTGTNQILTLRSVRTYSSAGSSTYTDFTAGQLGAVVVTPDGRLTRGDYNTFDYGVGNVAVEVEHGFLGWGEDLRKAALIRLRDVLDRPLSTTPERARRYANQDGWEYDLVDQSEFETGIRAVDAVYGRYSFRSLPGGDGRQVPASRQLNFDPSYYGLYNGGPR